MTEVVFPTVGGCMRPWIWPNGTLHVEPCKMDELRIGDIAVWFEGTRFIAHRVVSVGTDSIVTRRDSHDVLDPPVEPHRLLGRAVRFTKGPISYRLDGPLVAMLSRVAVPPWARFVAAARRGRDLLRRPR